MTTEGIRSILRNLWQQKDYLVVQERKGQAKSVGSFKKAKIKSQKYNTIYLYRTEDPPICPFYLICESRNLEKQVG